MPFFSLLGLQFLQNMPTVPDEIQQATSGCLRTWDNFLGQLYQAFSWGWQKHSKFGTQQWFLLPARGPVIPYPFQVSGKLVILTCSTFSGRWTSRRGESARPSREEISQRLSWRDAAGTAAARRASSENLSCRPSYDGSQTLPTGRICHSVTEIHN